MTIHIYHLRDPRNLEIRYVGMTRNMKRRLARHLVNKKGNAHLIEWIEKLRDLGLRPIIEAIESVDEYEADIREDEWIRKYRERNNRTRIAKQDPITGRFLPVTSG